MNVFTRGLVVAGLMAATVAAHAQVNVYSSRKEVLIKPLLDTFTEQTGIEVKLLTGKDDALLKRLAMEGMASPADVLITADVARLHRAKEQGLTQPVVSNVLEGRIGAQWRDADGYWFGATSRARPIIYAKDRVDPANLSSYEDLTDEQWRGRICIRSSSNVYNQSLVASKINADGAEATSEWLAGLVANFARPPAGGDTDQIRAAAAGVCDIAIANTYYLARLARSSKAADNAVAESVAVFWPNQDGRGAHFNVSGIALTKAAKNRDEAVQLMEFMVSDEAQQWYADVNNEYPVVESVAVAPVLQAFGEAKADSVALSRLGELNQQAIMLMDQAGWR